MLTSIISMFIGLLKLLLIIFSPLIAFSIYWIIYVTFKILYLAKFKKLHIPKRGKYNKISLLKRLFILFPQQFVIDFFNRRDYEFLEYGLHMITGTQGSGKTITLVYLLRKWRALYPHMDIMTNMTYKYQSHELQHWKDILNANNGILGTAVVIDEIQTWFNSLQSKDFPVEMLTEISQQRKQRKAIIGTAQLFNRIAKPIREQTHFVYVPTTIFGCLTIVRKTHEKFWDEKEQRFTKYTGMFFFVHDAELRDSFDTYQKIQKYSEQGFKPDSEHYKNEQKNYLFNVK